MRIAVIPARGGSRRIPRKNIKDFCGKPIIAYSIETALCTHLFDRVIVSTEDDEIAMSARRYGAAVLWRPEHLAEIGVPDCGTQEVTRHVVIAACPTAPVTNDCACCIYATAPLMTKEDLWAGFAMLASGVTPYVYAACGEIDAGEWYWGKARAFYDRIPLEGNSQLYQLPPERYCDINEPADWLRAEQMFDELRRNNGNGTGKRLGGRVR